MTRTQLLPEIFKLHPDEQLMIVEAIRNHLSRSSLPISDSEFKAELERRVADADANPLDESPLDSVISRLRTKR